MTPVELEATLRHLAPLVLGAVTRKFRDFAACEDAVQEALWAAARQWPTNGVPDGPRGWLIQVAARKLTDQHRAETARRHREELVVSLVPADEQVVLAADAQANERDDTLDVLFMCCHPALSRASAVALTLRAVAGLSTLAIAKAYAVPEATMAQRISRAKQTIKGSGVAFAPPSDDERAARLASVMEVLYLTFNEGYAATSGAEVVRVDLANEAIRLARLLAALLPGDCEVQGLLALMLLTDARRAARIGPLGEVVPLDEQDRTRWHRGQIDEGVALLTRVLPLQRVGPFQVQAAIAAVHDEAPSAEATDWPQILGLYGVLRALEPSPFVALNEAIAFAMVHGPEAGLERLAPLAKDARLVESHRLDAARAHLLERAGRRDEALTSYERAAQRTTSEAERDFLLLRLARLRETG